MTDVNGAEPGDLGVGDIEAAPTTHSASKMAWLRRVLPGAADLLEYRRSWLGRDLVAGLAVWAVLVQQGLAYGELAGLSPVAGLYAALGALLLYPLLGSSRISPCRA